MIDLPLNQHPVPFSLSFRVSGLYSCLKSGMQAAMAAVQTSQAVHEQCLRSRLQPELQLLCH